MPKAGITHTSEIGDQLKLGNLVMQSPSQKSTQESSYVSKKILIVEDEELCRESLAIALAEEGFQILVAENGEVACQKLLGAADGSQKPVPDISLVILDLMLPGMNGLDLCRLIRHRGLDMPILIISAKGAEIDRVVGLDVGANDYLSKPYGMREAIARCKALLRYQDYVEKRTIVRSINFSPEYREAGTSILTYFNHILKIKYPDVKVKVKIEQDDAILRMIISTPSGDRETIERTLEEYGMVVTGKLPVELFLTTPFEVMALKNKLEIANLELKQTRELLNFAQNNNQKQIESLEIEIERLHLLIERGLKSNDTTLEVIEQITKQEGKNYDLRGSKFGGGFATEGGHQEGGTFNDFSIEQRQSIADVAQEIQDLLQQLALKYPTETPTQRVEVAKLAVQEIEKDPTFWQRVIGAGKAAGMEALREAVDNPIFNIMSATLEGFIEP